MLFTARQRRLMVATSFSLTLLAAASPLRAQERRVLQTIVIPSTNGESTSFSNWITIGPGMVPQTKVIPNADGTSTTFTTWIPAGQQGPQRQLWNLQDALDVTNWEPTQRGPLIALNAKQVRPWTPKRKPGEEWKPYVSPQPLYAPATESARLLPPKIVAEYFGQKVVTLGTLAVVAPTEMTLLNFSPRKPDPLQGLRRPEKLKMLQSSLTASQWKMLGSETGLGANNMDSTQRALFDALIPNPFRVMRGTTMAGGGTRYTSSSTSEGNGPLSDAQRGSIRIRLNRSTQMYLTSPGTGNAVRYVTNIGKPEGSPILTLSYDGSDYNRDDLYGSTIRQDVPNKLKAGELDFALPEINIGMKIGPAKTVGDVLKTIRDTSHVEIYADGRLANLPLFVKGADQPIRASDLLQALCYAVTGTYRKVGEVYILTDDVVGLGTRRARIAEWVNDGQALQNQLRTEWDKKIRAQKPVQYLSFAPSDPLALDAATMGKIEEKWGTTKGRYEPNYLPVSSLSPEMQKSVREAVVQHYENYKNSNNTPGVVTDRVSVQVQTRLTYVIPGVGEVETQDGGWEGLTSLLPFPTGSMDGESAPATTPAKIPDFLPLGGTLLVAPQTAAEVTAAADAAQKRGLKYLWVQTPLDGKNEKELLTAAVAAGKERGLLVFGVLRLLATPVQSTEGKTTPLAENTEKDNNILGETSGAWAARRSLAPEAYPGAKIAYIGTEDFLRPDAPAVVARITRRVVEIGAIPGLAGLVLKDAAPPGYQTTDAPNFYYQAQGNDLGYTVENRVAMIRRSSYDPIDLSQGGNYGNVNTTLPFLGNDQPRYTVVDGEAVLDQTNKTPSQVWNKIRYEKETKFLADLYRDVRVALPKLPLVLESFGGTNPYGNNWYALWEKPDALPTTVTEANGRQKSAIDSARANSSRVLMALPMRMIQLARSPQPGDPVKPGSPQAVAQMFNALFKQSSLVNIGLSPKDPAKRWDGIVLDFSDLPVETALPLVLGSLEAPPGQN